MNEFSATWLHLREAVDQRSRSRAVSGRLSQAFGGRDHAVVVDIGCGTGANLRATAPLLGQRQDWTLLDNNPALLDHAAEALAQWADTVHPSQGKLVLGKGGRTIIVRFVQADAAGALGSGILGGAGLVTASAFFDLASERFIGTLAEATVRQGAAFHTVLTYDGRQAWSPAHPSDAGVREAFNAHQMQDKGFGPAAGPRASALLAQAFAVAGYQVVEGDSTWRLGPDDSALLDKLAEGVAAAAAETGLLEPGAVEAWRAWPRTGASTGHCDMLALPP